MSFSTTIKTELNKVSNSRHCHIAELLPYICNNINIVNFNGKNIMYLFTENKYLANRYYNIVKLAFNTNCHIMIRQNHLNVNMTYYLSLSDQNQVQRILNALNWSYDKINVSNFDNLLLKSVCCKKAYIRASFISNGSMTDPRKNYHLELVYPRVEQAEVVLAILEEFNLNPRLIKRKSYYVVYIKDSESISDFLNIVGAHSCLLEFESIRIIKNVSNEVNRKVNCETANMTKTVQASVSYEMDIKFIEKVKGKSYLSKLLREVAELRLEHPNATLKEIGQLMAPPISKSGVNHRLRKISELAEKLRSDYNG